MRIKFMQKNFLNRTEKKASKSSDASKIEKNLYQKDQTKILHIAIPYMEIKHVYNKF